MGLRIHGVKVVADSSLAFPGAALEDLKDCAFIAGYRLGNALDYPVTNTWAAFKTCWTNTANDKLESHPHSPRGERRDVRCERRSKPYHIGGAGRWCVLRQYWCRHR